MFKCPKISSNFFFRKLFLFATTSNHELYGKSKIIQIGSRSSEVEGSKTPRARGGGPLPNARAFGKKAATFVRRPKYTPSQKNNCKSEILRKFQKSPTSKNSGSLDT